MDDDYTIDGLTGKGVYIDLVRSEDMNNWEFRVWTNCRQFKGRNLKRFTYHLHWLTVL